MLCNQLGTRRSTLSLTEGYWRASNTSTIVYQCQVAELCVGGHDPATSCLGNRVGPLCAVCECSNRFLASF